MSLAGLSGWSLQSASLPQHEILANVADGVLLDPFGDVGSMSGLRESGHSGAIVSTYLRHRFAAKAIAGADIRLVEPTWKDRPPAASCSL
jgi:hypothetical protein